MCEREKKKKKKIDCLNDSHLYTLSLPVKSEVLIHSTVSLLCDLALIQRGQCSRWSSDREGEREHLTTLHVCNIRSVSLVREWPQLTGSVSVDAVQTFLHHSIASTPTYVREGRRRKCRRLYLTNYHVTTFLCANPTIKPMVIPAVQLPHAFGHAV